MGPRAIGREKCSSELLNEIVSTVLVLFLAFSLTRAGSDGNDAAAGNPQPVRPWTSWSAVPAIVHVIGPATDS